MSASPIKRSLYLAISVTAALLVSACSAHASVNIGNGTLTVKKADLEQRAAAQLASTTGQAAPTIVCPDDLKGEVGTVEVCELTDSTSSDTYDTTITVTSVDKAAKQVNFHIQVATTPNTTDTTQK